MLQRLVLLTSCVMAGCFAVTTVAQATVPSLAQAPVTSPVVEPLPPQDPNSAGIPIVVPTLNSPPVPSSPGSDLSLPDTISKPTQPLYHEQPIKPAQLPLRLEIKLSRRRVTVYRGQTPVKSYPVAVGRPGWETPKGTYKVQQMFRNPTWIHPLKKGVVIPGGDPENPLGRYWIGFWTDGKNWIGFHGTPNPKSVGTAASHGCIRMYNQDIEELFKKVGLGTEVKVVH